MAITMNKIKRSSGVSDPGKTSDLSAARDAAAAKPTRRSARGSEVVAREKKERREARGQGKNSDPGKTSDLSAARDAAAAKPTRRSARGSEVVAREKKERREARGQGKKVTARVSSTANRRGGGAAGRDGARGAGGGAKGAGGRTQRAAMRYATDNRFVSWVYDFTTGPRRYVFYLLVALFVGMGVYWPVRDFYIAHRTEAILQEQKAIRKRYNDTLGQEVEGLLSQEGVEDAARRDYGMVMPGEKTITVEGLNEDGEPVVVDRSDPDAAVEGTPGGGGEGSGQQGMVMPGEKTITVEGLNEDGEPVVVDRSDPDAAVEGTPGGGGEGSGQQGSTSTNGAASKNDEGKLKAEDAADKSKTGSDAAAPDPDKVPMTSAEVEAAERAVLENSNDEGKLKAEDAADKSKTGSDAAAPDPDKVPMTSAEVEAAERAVLENSEWYWKVLDSLFFFDGANGMAVVSTGE